MNSSKEENKVDKVIDEVLESKRLKQGVKIIILLFVILVILAVASNFYYGVYD